MTNDEEMFQSECVPESPSKLSSEPVFAKPHSKGAMWFGCLLWDDAAWQEFKIHEEMGSMLQTKMFLGRMLRNSVKKPVEGMAEQMQWKNEPFVLVR